MALNTVVCRGVHLVRTPCRACTWSSLPSDTVYICVNGTPAKEVGLTSNSNQEYAMNPGYPKYGQSKPKYGQSKPELSLN